jgi:DNA helicase-2/ATP-dependent DNA helicase PcrA
MLVSDAPTTRTKRLRAVAGRGQRRPAYRVAHLIAGSADPQRILLLTFSCRAAVEMERHAGQAVARVFALKSDRPPGLPWAGSFHGVGARLLREYAAHIGLNENFTIHEAAMPKT